MRPWFVASMLLSGCAGEFAGGQATDTLGLDPFGGAYNPSLAGCNLSELTASGGSGFAFAYEYDSRGRIQVSLYSNGQDFPTETETRWDGPCRVNDTTEAVNGQLRMVDFDCDAEGWPVSGLQRVLDSQLVEIESVELSWANTYEDGRLVHVDSWDGDSTDLEWADDRVVRREKTNINGVLDTNTYAYNDDGWILEMTMNELVTTYAYDDRKRLMSAVQGESRTDWSYREDGDKWPYLRTYNGSTIEQGTELQFDCP